MSFSERQQVNFRKLEHVAWTKHCEANGIEMGPKKDRAVYTELFNAWHREQLMKAVGKDSTTMCDRKRDFIPVMAHFEELADTGFYWRFKTFDDSERRVIHAIKEVCHAADFSEDYARGIARQALRRDDTPLLESLNPAQLITVLRALKIHAKRNVKQTAEEPF